MKRHSRIRIASGIARPIERGKGKKDGLKPMRYLVATHGRALHVRIGPGARYQVISSLRNGVSVEVTNTQNGWSQLETGGWVTAHLLRQAAGAPLIPQEPRLRGAINWANLWSNYPTLDSDDVKRAIGGHVNADWIENTCTIRLSRALNYGGSPIPTNFNGLHVVTGADHMFYAFRVREMRAYLEHLLGPPTIRATGGERQRAVTGHRGIIMFDVRIWNDASGHMDLWDGNTIRYHAYFAQAAEILLWEIP